MLAVVLQQAAIQYHAQVISAYTSRSLVVRLAIISPNAAIMKFARAISMFPVGQLFAMIFVALL